MDNDKKQYNSVEAMLIDISEIETSLWANRDVLQVMNEVDCDPEFRKWLTQLIEEQDKLVNYLKKRFKITKE